MNIYSQQSINDILLVILLLQIVVRKSVRDMIAEKNDRQHYREKSNEFDIKFLSIRDLIFCFRRFSSSNF